MRGCDDCLENKRILHAMRETYAMAVSAPGWADELLAQINEEDFRPILQEPRARRFLFLFHGVTPHG